MSDPLTKYYNGARPADFTPGEAAALAAELQSRPEYRDIKSRQHEEISKDVRDLYARAYPGGIGLSEPLYRLHDRLLAESRSLIAACACSDGCPSCVGPAGEVGSRGKEVALAILDAVLGG